jgi:mono/diheme cytochrome c family protein
MMDGCRQRVWLVTLAALALTAGQAPADTPAPHPIIPGFERLAPDAQANQGTLLLTELNCVGCHKAADLPAPRQPPVLDGVGSRVRAGWLRKFLADPQAEKPGTTMPGLFAGDPDRDAKVEALVHFLAATGSVGQERPDGKAVAPGQELYQTVGCVACHGPRDAAGLPPKELPASVVPLGDLKAKYSIPSLAAFLENPHGVRPSGRMPKLLAGKEAKDVANYLLQGIKGDFAIGGGSATFAYYEGAWDKVPDFAKLKPAATGTGAAFDLGSAKRPDNFGIQFNGFFKADKEGEYHFTIHSDDGSNLYVDGRLVANNDGVHPPKAITGSVKLTAGVHKVTVDFFQVGGGAELDVQVEGPGLGRQDFAPLVAATEAALEKKEPKPKKDDPDVVDVRPELVEKGRTLFASVGCASCHQLNIDKKLVASSLTPPALDKLKPEGGCLAATTPKGLPAFGLSAAQRTALAAAVKKPTPAAKEPAAVIARTLATFNCYACHARDKVGGPEETLNPFFKTTQPEMGDEGRVPPPLDFVGAKLNPDYLKQVLDKGAHDRPYMHTHMPGFGLANLGPLAEAFAAVDKVEAAPAVQFSVTEGKVKAAARHVIGGQALGCIKCHTFNNVKAEGIQGIDMAKMTQRVQHDWFRVYLLDPQRIRPGTRMPASWPNGKSFYDDVLDGKAETQVEAIWVYLKDGGNAQIPAGMGKQSIPLVPKTGAILYRNFIQGAGSRAIGVGYPEKVSLAFDANELRLALLWQGDFIDAAKHWTDRGEGFQGPLGDDILKLPAGTGFAVLPAADATWPTATAKELGSKFNGYQLTPDDRPTFLYTVGDVKVEDFPNPTTGKELGLHRILKLIAAKGVDNLYFRAAAGTKIESLGEGWYRIDGWKMKIDGGTPQIRQSGGKAELLVPVRFADGKAEIVQEFVW